MPRKKKTANEMTNDELIRHLFHPVVVKHAKNAVKEANAKATKKATK